MVNLYQESSYGIKKKKYFCINWKERHDRWMSEEYDSYLQNIQDKIQKKVTNIINNLEDINEESNIQYPKINSCLINKYLNGKDSIKPHSIRYLVLVKVQQ